jgi:polyisoprenoid-binding protein YceI
MSTTKSTFRARLAGMARWKKLVIGGGFALVAILAVGIWWFLRDDAPKAVDLEAAVGAISTEGTTTPAGAVSTEGTTPAGAVSTEGTAGSAGGVAGDWVVDTSVGEFSFEDSTGTFVGFRVSEELSGIGSTTAVGRTPAVTGTMTIDGTTLAAATIEADMTVLTTNDSRRDDRALGALETDQFPSATFVLTGPIDLGDAATTGAQTAVTATGDLTVHGVTKSVEIPLEAQLVGDTIVVVGSLDVVFSDFGVTVPSAPIVLSVDDRGQMELQLFFSRAG